MTINVTFNNFDEVEEFSRMILYSPPLRKPRSEREPADKGRKPESVPDSKTINRRRAAKNEDVKTEDEKRKAETADADGKTENGFTVISNGKTEKAPLKTKPRKKLDKGKILALKNAGWDVKKIADEMRCSTWSVYNATKHYK